MEGKSSKSINPITVGLVVLQIIFMIIVGVTLSNIFKEEKIELGIEVAGLQQEIEGLPEESKNSIEFHIYKTVSDNINQNIQKTGVVIREGSLINNYYDKFDIHYINFIADIPELEQSYQVFYEWSKDKANKYISPDSTVAVVCLDESQLIYGPFECNHENDYLRKTEVYNMLYRYGYRLSSTNDLVAMPESYSSSSDSKVKLYYLTCEGQCICMKVSDEKKEEGIYSFESLVEGLGFRLEDIPYYFDNCS